MEIEACSTCGTAAKSLRKCSGCRKAQYCTRDCRRQHWRNGHKRECIRLDQKDTTWATTATSLSTNSSADADAADTIYYLMTAIPAINDMTSIGPFPAREAFAPFLIQKVQHFAPEAVDSLQMRLSDSGLSTFETWSMCGSNIGNHKLELRVHKESNAKVKAALPCRTWNLTYSEVANDMASLTTSEWAGQFDDMQIHGTFLSKEAAEIAGSKVAEATLGGSGEIEELDPPGQNRLWMRGRNPMNFVQVGSSVPLT